MTEETNQMMEEQMDELPENLFEDEDVGGETDINEAEEEEGSEAETEQTEAGDQKNGENHAEGSGDGSSVIRIKYNGEERELSLEEARTLAQKGLNYDHVVEERDRNRSAFDFLMENAKKDGITVEELIKREKGKVEERRLEAKMEEIRERDDDASEETIKSLARLELEAESARADKEKADALEKKKNDEIEGWNKLFNEHPELIGKDVPQKVFELVGKGFSPVEAYFMERTRVLEEQAKVLSDAEAAKKKSVGSLSGVQIAEEDDFLAGFNGE
jgi:hypothetical protein